MYTQSRAHGRLVIKPCMPHSGFHILKLVYTVKYHE